MHGFVAPDAVAGPEPAVLAGVPARALAGLDAAQRAGLAVVAVGSPEPEWPVPPGARLAEHERALPARAVLRFASPQGKAALPGPCSWWEVGVTLPAPPASRHHPPSQIVPDSPKLPGYAEPEQVPEATGDHAQQPIPEVWVAH